MKPVKQLCSEALLSLSETKPIKNIKVSEICKAAGISRQTFYSSFSDMNELIAYTGISFTTGLGIRLGTFEGVRQFYLACLHYKSFFVQLPKLTGQNNFRDTFTEWLFNACMTDAERESAEGPSDAWLSLRYCVHGSVDLFMEWLATGMTWSPDQLARVVSELRFNDPPHPSPPPPSRS